MRRRAWLSKRLAALVAATVCLCAPTAARAHGDPASDDLLTTSVFLPFATRIDRNEVQRLGVLLREAGKVHFRIRAALILSPSDLGTAFSLFGKPQKYAEFLGQELSFVYRDRSSSCRTATGMPSMPTPIRRRARC